MGWVTKLLISQVKKKDFLPQNDQIWPKIGNFGQFGPGHAGFFGALLVGRLVVVARGLYLARHLFTLWGLPCAWSSLPGTICLLSRATEQCLAQGSTIHTDKTPRKKAVIEPIHTVQHFIKSNLSLN